MIRPVPIKANGPTIGSARRAKRGRLRGTKHAEERTPTVGPRSRTIRQPAGAYIFCPGANSPAAIHVRLQRERTQRVGLTDPDARGAGNKLRRRRTGQQNNAAACAEEKEKSGGGVLFKLTSQLLPRLRADEATRRGRDEGTTEAGAAEQATEGRAAPM